MVVDHWVFVIWETTFLRALFAICENQGEAISTLHFELDCGGER